MSYSHLDHANAVEPAEGHRHLREQCRLHTETMHDPPFHVVSRHADVRDMLLRPAEWCNGYGVGVNAQPSGVLGTADDPDHRRHRRVLQDAFRPISIARLDDDVRHVADQLWERAFGTAGEGDFVHLFAFPFPAAVIAVLLGVPTDRRDDFGRWSDDIVNALGGADPSVAEAANRQIFALVDDLVADRADLIGRGAEPPDDVLTVMTRAARAGTLSHHEVRRLSQQLLVAGHETTASLISLMLYRLIDQPELVDQLRADPALIPSAVEEFLRFDSPVQGLFRSNPTPAAAGGQALPADSRVQALFAGANRDDDVYERADELVLDRFASGGVSHLAFGWGVHHCIGAALARAEGRLALELILDRFDTVERIGDVAVNEPFILRGLTTLPIRWTVRRPTATSTTTATATATATATSTPQVST